MIYVAKPYMLEARTFVLDTPRCNLWLDPGLGKTGIVLSALDILMLAGSNKFPALVTAPARVARSVWTNERDKFETFRDIDISMMVGNPAQREKALNLEAMVYTINYENLPWLIHALEGRPWPFKTVIADESTRLRGFRLRRSTKRSAALSKAAKFTARWVNLTGTPAPNGLIDLWGQNWFVDKGRRLGTNFTWFKDRWFDEDKEAHKITPKAHAQEEITRKLSDVTLSLSAEDCLPNLKKPYVNDIKVELSGKAMAMYREFERDMCLEIEMKPVLEAQTAADLSGKCLQLASGACFADENNKTYAVIHDEKIEALRSLLTELSGNPLLVAYHWKHDLWRLLKAFPEGKHLKTVQDENAWNEERYPVAFVHPQSAGHGLNLQYGGHHICFFSQWWDLEYYQQVIDRIGPVRQKQAGLNRKVGIHHIITSGTLDETVMTRRKTKCGVQDLLRQRVQFIRLESTL